MGPAARLERTVFVTVGTTKFDALIRAVDQQAFADVLVAAGYTRLVMQIGRWAGGEAVGGPGRRLVWARQEEARHRLPAAHPARPARGAPPACPAAVAQGGLHAPPPAASQPALRGAAQRAECGVL